MQIIGEFGSSSGSTFSLDKNEVGSQSLIKRFAIGLSKIKGLSRLFTSVCLLLLLTF